MPPAMIEGRLGAPDPSNNPLVATPSAVIPGSCVAPDAVPSWFAEPLAVTAGSDGAPEPLYGADE